MSEVRALGSDAATAAPARRKGRRSFPCVHPGWTAVLLALSCLLATGRLSHAQAPPELSPRGAGRGRPAQEAERKRKAEALKLAGREKYRQREFGHAERLFLQAFELDPRTAYLFNAARCRDKLGRHVEALDLLERFMAVEAVPAKRVRAQKLLRAVETRALTTHARLQVDSRPPAAAVFLDAYTQARGKTPMVLWLSGGKHALRLRRDGFAPAEERIEVRVGERRELHVKLARSPAQGRVRLEGLPPGTRLLVKGQEVGRTPLPEPLRLPPGLYSIAILHPDHLPTQLSVEVEAGADTIVLATLQAAPRTTSAAVARPSVAHPAPTHPSGTEADRQPPVLPRGSTVRDSDSRVTPARIREEVAVGEGNMVRAGAAAEADEPDGTNDERPPNSSGPERGRKTQAPSLTVLSWGGVIATSTGLVTGTVLLALSYQEHLRTASYGDGQLAEWAESRDRANRLLRGSVIGFVAAGFVGAATSMLIWHDLQRPELRRDGPTRATLQRRSSAPWFTFVPGRDGGMLMLRRRF